MFKIKIRTLLLVFILTITLTGCSTPKSRETILPKPKETITFPSYFIAWNDIIYGLTNDIVPADKISTTIGEVKRFVSPKPEKNGDAGTILPESKNVIPVGSKLYLIKGIRKDEAIAVEIWGEFRKAIKNRPLK
ncbi:MAG: hypothetical protein ACOY4Q_00335 [Bacillota bacterium]